MASPQLQNIGLALQGFSAGLQGQLPQFQAAQNQRQQLQMQQEEQRQKMIQERQKTMFTDANAALNLLDSGNVDGVVMLGMNRLQALKQLSSQFPDIDPSDTQRITQLAIAAKNGSEEAEELLRGELSTIVELGQSYGILQAPEASTKVVGNYLVDDKTGKVVFDASQEGPRERAQDQNGVLRYIDDGSPVFPQVSQLDSELSDKDKFDRAKAIRGEITNDTKEFTQIANSWDRIAASANDPSAAGDLALIFNFMKMLDPGSTVREGEFATAQQAAGIPTRIVNLYNQALKGERLSETQRSDFFGQAQNIFDASKGRAENIVGEYVRLGEKYGLTRDDLVIERGDSPEINMQPSSVLKEITSQAEYDALPSGALYLEDGVRYRKP